jgi:hypothetical protein
MSIELFRTESHEPGEGYGRLKYKRILSEYHLSLQRQKQVFSITVDVPVIKPLACLLCQPGIRTLIRGIIIP